MKTLRNFVLVIFSLITLVSANAQIAVEDSKPLDNTFITVNGKVSTPLSFDAVFPVNTIAGISVGKWFSPVFGAEIEGEAWFGSHTYGGSDARYGMNMNGNFNAVRRTYVGSNALVNLNNLFAGYVGAPRKFEANLVGGIGWFHTYRPNMNDEYNNSLGTNTGIDLAYNFGQKKANALSFKSGIYWDLSKPGTKVGSLAFNKLGAEFYVGLAYTYKFLTSNGTHNFKTYDVGAMMSEIERLNNELANKSNGLTNTVIDTVYINSVQTIASNEYVFFAKNSYELTNEAKNALDKVSGTVEVVGYASPEGSSNYNVGLSERRAAAVADYLTKRGVKVESWKGKGVNGDASGRVAIITKK